MTITGGQVRIHELLSSGAWGTYGGSINPAGEVSATILTRNKRWFSLSGAIYNKVFTGQRVNGAGVLRCFYSVEMAPASAPTMSFDGVYSGVSREVSDSGSNEHRFIPHALAPPIRLTITNGVVGIPGEYWEGTVSAQGAVVIRSHRFSRVDGQIDHQGTIRGQYSGELPPDLARIGTNCIVKFVWQRE